MPPKNKYTDVEITQAALEIARRSGMDAVTARAVADSLQASPKVIFGQFPGMDALRDAVVCAADAQYQGYIRREIDRGVYPPYKASGMAYIRFAREEPKLFQLLFMRDRTGKEKVPGKEYASVLDLIVQSNGFTLEQAELLHMEMWTCVHGLAAMIATGFEKTPFPTREPAKKPREIEHDRLFGSFGTSSLNRREEPQRTGTGSGSLFSSTGETPTFMGSSRPSMGVPGSVGSGSFQTGFSYQQTQPQQPLQTTRPFQPQAEQPAYGQGQVFQNAPQQPYQPTFGSNGQVTGGFSPIPQTQAMTTDSHGVQGYLRRKK